MKKVADRLMGVLSEAEFALFSESELVRKEGQRVLIEYQKLKLKLKLDVMKAQIEQMDYEAWQKIGELRPDLKSDERNLRLDMKTREVFDLGPKGEESPSLKVLEMDGSRIRDMLQNLVKGSEEEDESDTPSLH